MPNNKYDYTVKIGADISNLKKDIKSELASVLREVDNVGDAVSKGITPDTKEFESKIASLESKMEKLAQNSKDVEQQVSSMKTAFKGFTELEASMKAIGEQNKEMYETFVKMTPYLQEFAKTFTAMKPEQAGAAFESVMKNASASGQASAQAFKDMQGAVQQAGAAVHQVKTDAVSGAKVIGGAVEVAGHSLQNMAQDAKEASKELARLKELDKTYNSDKKYNGLKGQSSLRNEIAELIKLYELAQKEEAQLADNGLDSGPDYNKTLISAIENAQKLLALFNKLDKKDPESLKLQGNISVEDLKDDLEYLFSQYEKQISEMPAQIGQVKLKPLTLKVKLEDDDKILATVNGKIDKIKEKVEALRVPIDFYDPDEELRKLEKKKEKLKKSEPVNEEELQKTLDEEAYNKTFNSLQKKAERIRKAFVEASKDLSKELSDFKDNIDDALTLKFKWNKTDDNGEIGGMFAFIQSTAAENPIELFPDTEKLISDIQNKLNEHKFTLELDGAANITGSFSGNINVPVGSVKPVAGALPVVFKNPISGSTPPVTRQPTNNKPVVPLASSATPAKTVQDQLEEKVIERNSNVVDENTDIIKSVVDVFKNWLSYQQKSQYGSSRLAALESIGMDFRNLNDNQLYSFVENLLLNNPSLGERLSRAKIGTSKDASYVFNSKFIDKIVDAQKQLGVEISTERQEDDRIISQEYLKQAESLARMGTALNKAYSDLERQRIPYQKPLENVVDLFNNNDWVNQWGNKIVEVANQNLKKAQADLAAAPSKIESAQNSKNEADARVAKMAEKVTEAETAYNAAEATYNEAKQKLELAKQSGNEDDIKSANASFKQAEQDKQSKFTALKNVERSAVTAKENADKAAIAFNDAKSKAELAQTAVRNAEERLQDAMSLTSGDSMFDEVSVTAKELLSKMQDLTTRYASDLKGGITEYLDKISRDILVENENANNESLSASARKKAAEESTRLSGIRDSIINEIKPYVENFDNAKKSIVGDIAKLLGGYKFEVVFKDSKGRDIVYSFNNAVEGADRESGPYWSNWVDMMNDLIGKEITKIRTTSTPNMSDLRIPYEGTMTKSNAVNSIVGAYSQLDDKTRSFVDGFISDIDLFLDEGASASKRWKVIEESFFEHIRYRGMDQLGVNSKLNTKYKSVTNKEDEKTLMGTFMRALSDALEGVNAEKRTRASRQRQMARGVDSPTAVVEKPKNVAASQREYTYGAQDREYRTDQLPILYDLDAALEENKVVLTKANTDLANYDAALRQAEQSHKEEKEKLDTTTARKELQKKYSGITDSQSFQTQYNMSEQEVRVLRDIVAENTKKAESVNNATNQLYADLQENETLISAIQSRVAEVSKAGGVQKYLEQLNKDIKDSETLVANLNDARDNYAKRLEDLDYDYEKGNISKKQWESGRKEIEDIIAEDNEIIKAEQEKWRILTKTRGSFTADISGYDKKTGTPYQLSDEEYYTKKNQDLADAQKKNAEIQQAVIQSESVLAEANSKLQSTKAQLEAEEKNLEQMKIAFAEYYYQYVNQLLRETSNEISKIEDAQKTGRLKEIGFDENSANARLSTLKEKSRYYSSESSRFSSILNPETGYETRIESARKKLDEAQKKVDELEKQKSQLEQRIANVGGTEIIERPALIKSVDDETKKLLITNEVEAINNDLQLADAKIEEAKKEKDKIQRKIDSLTKYGAKSGYARQERASQTVKAAEWLEKNDEAYQKLIEDLRQQVIDGQITKEAANEKRLEYVRKFKENNSEYAVNIEELIANQRRLREEQDRLIQEAKDYQAQLEIEKKKALEILGITEEQLFAQKEITKNKQEQNGTATPSPTTAPQSNRQQSSSTPTQDIEKRVEEQSNNIDSTFVAKIDAKLADNDKKIAELQAQVGTGSKDSPTKKFKEYFVGARSKTIGDAADRLNRDFYNTLKQGPKNKKGQTFADFSDAGNIDAIIKKARELRASLHQMYSDGKEGSKEFLVIQQQLTDLLERTRKNVSKTDLANGYEKNQDKTMSKKAWEKFLTDRGAGDLTKFTGTKYNLNSNKNISSAILTDEVQATIDGLSEEYQQAAIKAYTDAFNAKKASLKNSGKNKGRIESIAKDAALKAFDEFIRTQKDGFIAGTQESANSPETEAAKVKLAEEIGDIEEENKELKDLRERYIKGMLSEEDNDLLASFVADSILDENQVGTMMQRAVQEAKSSVDKTGKTESQITDETKELFKKKLFSMLIAVIGGARQGVEEADDNFEEPSSGSSIVYGGQGYVGEGGYVQLDGITIQAGNVVVNGNTVGTSSDGTGPWALETTLQRTNEILNSISGKIDSIKGSSGSSNDSPVSGSGKKKKKKKEEEIDVNAVRQRLESEAADNRKRFSIDGLEDSIKSVQKFDEKTLKLYETFTLANGEAVKFTYSLNTMDGTIKSSYTTIANFEGVAKKAYTELGKSQIATKQLFEGFNFPQDKITAYNNAIAALNNKLKGLGENGITDPKDANEVEVLTGNVKRLRTEIENMVKASEKTANSGTLVKKFNAGEVDNVKASMKALAEEIPNASLAASNFNDKTNELTFTVKTGKNELTTLTYKFDELTQSVYETGRASKTTTGFFKSFFSDVGTKIAELARYYTGMSLLTEGLQQVRRGVQYVREIDLALTELKKVTDETDAAYTKFLQNMSKTASVVGSTTSELTNSAADWARLGYSMEQAGELAKNTAILMNVSEFDNVNDATSALISTLQAFNYSAEDSLEIVDKLNIVGNNFAISSDGIASGLQRSASTLVAAGNSLEQSIAMLAAGNKVMQDPEALGNALKVLSMRIRGTKTELEEAGEETDGMAENTSKLRKQVMALTNIDGNGGVDILTDSGAFRSTYDILYDIAQIWDQLNDYDPKAQAALLELLAGECLAGYI